MCDLCALEAVVCIKREGSGRANNLGNTWVFQHAAACLFSVPSHTHNILSVMFDSSVLYVRVCSLVVCLCLTGLLQQASGALCILLKRLFFHLKDSINLSRDVSEPHLLSNTHKVMCLEYMI